MGGAAGAFVGSATASVAEEDQATAWVAALQLTSEGIRLRSLSFFFPALCVIVGIASVRGGDSHPSAVKHVQPT